MAAYYNNHYVSHLCPFVCLLMHMCRFFHQMFLEHLLLPCIVPDLGSTDVTKAKYLSHGQTEKRE